MSDKIVIAGATGDLGGRIARDLVGRGAAEVTAVVRRREEKSAALERAGVKVVDADFADARSLARACAGAACVVSALAGLREVIVDVQERLVDAAVEAGVPRFIPSDFALDYTKQPVGWNRNLDFRRELRARLEGKRIAATSILNGMFAELLVGPAPFLLFKIRRALYWESPDQLLDFTAMDDVALYTARAAVDPTTPRDLRIAGEAISARGLAEVATRVTGKRFKLLRGGGLGRLEKLIKVARFFGRGDDEIYPAWQGMQYTHNMFAGHGKLASLDNARYPDVRWTPIEEVLTAARPRP